LKITKKYTKNKTMDITTIINNENSATMEQTASTSAIRCNHCIPPLDFASKRELRKHHQVVHQAIVTVTLLKDDGTKDIGNGTNSIYCSYSFTYIDLYSTELHVERDDAAAGTFACPCCQKVLNGPKAVHKHVPRCELGNRVQEVAVQNSSHPSQNVCIYQKEPSGLLRPPLDSKAYRRLFISPIHSSFIKISLWHSTQSLPKLYASTMVMWCQNGRTI
jgi:hypothetical protein